jgi:hypothetical protein
MTWHLAFHNRAEELGHKIKSIRERAARDPDLSGFEDRHADLRHRLQDLKAGTEAPEPLIVDGLHADFDNLEQAIGHWIGRQDANAARH